MASWQEIVRRANESQADSQTKAEEARRKITAEEEAITLEYYAKIQAERDEVFKKFSVRETLDAIRRDVWKEGEIVELKPKQYKLNLDYVRRESLIRKERPELADKHEMGFYWGGLELRALIPVPVAISHFKHSSGGDSQAEGYSFDLEYLDGVEMGKTFMTIGVDMRMGETPYPESRGGKRGRALYYGVNPYVNMEWITRELKGRPFSEASLEEKVRAGESLQFGCSDSNKVFIDYPDAQSKFISALALNISGAALPREIRQVFST